MTPIDAMAAPPGRGEFTGTLIYTVGEYNMIRYSLAVAAFAMLAGFVYAISTRNDVSPRYRGAGIASALVHAVAFLAYLALSVDWRTSYTLRDGLYVPVETSAFDGGLRYADWSVTVPLLAVELLTVCAVAGKRLFTLRALAIASAFLMIVTGFLGAQVLDAGTRVLWLAVWAAVSTVFFLVLYAVLGKAVLDSVRELPSGTSTTLKRATIMLFSVFGAYPLIYLIQQSVGADSDLVAWAMVTQLGLCAADIVAKVGFGAMIHKVAKMRTAEDVRSGTETHPEEVWISSVKQADAWPPVAAALTGHSAHPEPVRVADGNGHRFR
ncbi:bacteriorhodopsin [Streptomyces sp. Tu 3180]|uniref:bacteriorhodopsin n=1 Tax=Streptomyces sp. Tu 3180 TaxID=2682611 RepID=UPI001358FB2A|nr:bacteriorhodopsin [Streptomyces sp. Tu 3180]KAF3469254.1 bacteriorhodopsin [Streptomyces sp. Tu 3180]